MIIIPISCISVKSVDINEILFIQKPESKKPCILVTTDAEYDYPLEDIFDYLESNYNSIFIRIQKQLIINTMYIKCIDSYYHKITFFNNRSLDVAGSHILLVKRRLPKIPDIANPKLLQYAY